METVGQARAFKADGNGEIEAAAAASTHFAAKGQVHAGIVVDQRPKQQRGGVAKHEN